MSADVTNSRHRPSAGPPPSESALARRATPEGKSRSATTDEVMDMIVSISSAMLCPSLSFFSSFLRGSDETLLSNSYILAFFILQMNFILVFAGFGLCLALTSEFSRGHKQFVCNLSIFASVSYVFLVSTFGLLSLVMHFVPFSSSVDHVVGIMLCLLFLASHGIVFIWTVTLRIFNDPDVVAVRVVSTALVIALVSYGVGFGLQCIATMVTNVSIFWTAHVHIQTIMMLAQKHGRGGLFF